MKPINYKNNYNLKHLTWFKVGGPAEIFFKPSNINELIGFLTEERTNQPITIIGAGSNIIIRDGGISGVVLKLGAGFNNIEIMNDNRLKVGANCLNFNLAKFCQLDAIAGFEFMSGIPGTIGGGIAMNAGAYGTEFKDIIISVEAVDYNGNIINLTLDEITFKHRGNNLPKTLIFTSAIFKFSYGNIIEINHLINEFNEKRILTQPIKECTGGSTFVNPEPHKAWELIDRAGLRGYKLGGASMSTLHCNFMINHDNASAANLEDLGEFVRDSILTQFGISLEWEIKRLGIYHG